jgi:NADH:ubiquinone oxidoreductase subunit K
VAEWLKATNCKSVEDFLHRFESCQLFVLMVAVAEFAIGLAILVITF